MICTRQITIQLRQQHDKNSMKVRDKLLTIRIDVNIRIKTFVNLVLIKKDNFLRGIFHIYIYIFLGVYIYIYIYIYIHLYFFLGVYFIYIYIYIYVMKVKQLQMRKILHEKMINGIMAEQIWFGLVWFYGLVW